MQSKETYEPTAAEGSGWSRTRAAAAALVRKPQRSINFKKENTAKGNANKCMCAPTTTMQILAVSLAKNFTRNADQECF